MAFIKKGQVRKLLKVFKIIVMVLVFKVGFGAFDMGSDIVNGYQDGPSI